MKSWIVGVFLLPCSLALGQQAPVKLTFEVASIKPAEPSPANQIRMNMSVDAGMARYTNFSLKDYIRVAFRVKDFQVEGPDWIGNTRFDVVAKLPAGSSQDQIPEMLQALLAERFKLTLHRDTKEHAIYALVAGKGGPKLKAAEVPTGDGAAAAGSAGRGGPPRGGMTVTVDGAGAHLKAPSATLGALGELISRFSDLPIVDMTGIQGQYDFDLVFTPENLRGVQGGARIGTAPPGEGGGPADAASDHAGSIYDSVQPYGLKLERRKSPMEMILVDHIESKPTEN